MVALQWQKVGRAPFIFLETILHGHKEKTVFLNVASDKKICLYLPERWHGVFFRINLGISNIVHGFGDVRRCAKLWLFEFALTLLVYPALRLHAAGASLLNNQLGESEHRVKVAILTFSVSSR